MLSRADFMVSFAAQLAELSAAERITKEKLKDMSRSLLGALVGAPDYDALLLGDIQFINSVIPILTPMNKKTFVLFMQEFSGFNHEVETCVFTTKVQRDKVKIKERTLAFLEDPHNNIWTWAEKNVKVEKKAFKLEQVTKIIEKAREATEGNDEAILLAVLDGGISIESLVLVMEHMAQRVEAEKAEKPAFVEALM